MFAAQQVDVVGREDVAFAEVGQAILDTFAQWRVIPGPDSERQAKAVLALVDDRVGQETFQRGLKNQRRYWPFTFQSGGISPEKSTRASSISG